MGEGRETSPEVLAGQMLHLQAIGCHNINWVTPTHVVPMLLKALLMAIPQGLHLPWSITAGDTNLLKRCSCWKILSIFICRISNFGTPLFLKNWCRPVIIRRSPERP